MKIPFVDLEAQYRSIADEIDPAMQRVIADRAFIRGPHVEAFERRFADVCGAEHCIGVGSGTDALFVALKALDLGPEDEVIVPANSFVATAEAVTMAGAKVVFADVDPGTYNVGRRQIEEKITAHTRALVPVHLFGQPAEIDDIAALAAERRLALIQDSAQAHGATFSGRRLADYGGTLCFSFYPGKNLGAYGDAGAIVTNDESVASFARMFANHGRSSKYDHAFEGVCSRMDGLQGAVLGVKLGHLDGWIEKRRAHAALYDRLLADFEPVTCPRVERGAGHVYHLYVVRARERDKLRQHLAAQGIASGVHYPIALPNLQAYRHLGHRPEDFPVASRAQSEILSLPIFPELTEEQARYVVDGVRDFYG